ncbi:BamA/TamA family outer membrane protein [Rhodohalobacter sp. 614A]|uniref:BamA/TamA family outer membrane protein n=1 Tax=Rhodohalobacter sp. 614A TaxID=2908649 RepID=UPI001F2F1E5A
MHKREPSLVKIYTLILIAILIITESISAQGFNVFNSRNHPELKWQVVETEHFKIIYPERIEGIEILAGTIAEETYDALSKNLGVTFTDKVRLYLSDEDEIENGFANPIGGGYSMMWVNVNGFRAGRNGSVKWLRHVMSHELGHIFHYKAVESKIGMLQYVIATPISRHWTEGLAQYETEEWNSQRGDRWLRKAIFDSRPGFRDGSSVENGSLMYAVGNSQLRYFTETYGDSTLAKMFSWRGKRLGLLEYHDFEKAFHETVDGGYDAFYEEWRKHMNIYYNTLAASMERTDSLGSESFNMPGQFYLDMVVRPDDSLIAVQSIPSMSRQVRSLYIVTNDSTRESRKVAEGNINYDLSWSKDGKSIFYSRRSRGENSSLSNDVYVLNIETGREQRITHSRKAAFPAPGPNESEIAYIVNEAGTGNLFTRNLETGEEIRVTNYKENVQLSWPVWLADQQRWLLYKFDGDWNRKFILLNPESGEESVLLDNGQGDNQRPILNHDGTKFAYNSLQDEVPNIFVYDFETDSSRRVTNLFTGGEVYGWIAETDSVDFERLLVNASETKRRDHLFWVDVNRTPKSQPVEIPEAYSNWRLKSPPNQIPFQIEGDPSEVVAQYEYQPLKNITHIVSFALPYYADTNNWGLWGMTNWMEPIGKHLVTAFGSVSLPTPAENSYGAINYQNNQLYPSLTFSAYSFPANSRFYGDKFLVEELTGGEVSAVWPLDTFERSYQSSTVGIRFRHVNVDPDNYDFSGNPRIPEPVEGRQTDLQIEWILRKQKPWRLNAIHPLDGYGIKARLLGAEKVLGGEVGYFEADLNAYAVLPSIGAHRFYLHARYQQQWGDPLPQNKVNLTRYDNITITLPDQVFIQFFDNSERVRGYRQYVAGKRVLFGSAEYRMPFIPSLQTEILGLIQLGSTSLTLFTDAAIVGDAIGQDGSTNTIERWGAGAEIKNELQIFGLKFAHSLGVAQPVESLFEDDFVDLYYRVKAVVPF